MHAVTRSYSGKGAKELIDVLERNKADIEKLIKSIRGFVSYSLVRTPEGGFSVSVFQDKAGVEESVRVARDWIGKNQIMPARLHQPFRKAPSFCN